MLLLHCFSISGTVKVNYIIILFQGLGDGSSSFVDNSNELNNSSFLTDLVAVTVDATAENPDLDNINLISAFNTNSAEQIAGGRNNQDNSMPEIHFFQNHILNTTGKRDKHLTVEPIVHTYLDENSIRTKKETLGDASINNVSERASLLQADYFNRSSSNYYGNDLMNTTVAYDYFSDNSTNSTTDFYDYYYESSTEQSSRTNSNSSVNHNVTSVFHKLLPVERIYNANTRQSASVKSMLEGKTYVLSTDSRKDVLHFPLPEGVDQKNDKFIEIWRSFNESELETASVSRKEVSSNTFKSKEVKLKNSPRNLKERVKGLYQNTSYAPYTNFNHIVAASTSPSTEAHQILSKNVGTAGVTEQAANITEESRHLFS